MSINFCVDNAPEQLKHSRGLNLPSYCLPSYCLLSCCLLLISFLSMGVAHSASFLISIGNPSTGVTLNAAGQSAFFENAGILNDGANPPISLCAAVVPISADDTICIFRGGGNPVVRANIGSLEAPIRWHATNQNTGAPIAGGPAILISGIDGAVRSRACQPSVRV